MSELPIGEGLFPAQGSYRFTHSIEQLRALGNNVLVRDMTFSSRKLSSGIILLGDDAKTNGIRPRWAKVYAVGPEQNDVAVGQWIMIEHGRWSRGIEVEVKGEQFTLRRIDPNCILFVSDDEPDYDDTISSAVQAQSLSR